MKLKIKTQTENKNEIHTKKGPRQKESVDFSLIFIYFFPLHFLFLQQK